MGKREKLGLHEIPIIKPWRCGYCETPVDTKDLVEICTWCRTYCKQSPDKDTENVLDRLNIAVYQLGYVGAMLGGKVCAREWSESVCSALVHLIGALELCGVCCAMSLTDGRSDSARSVYWRVLEKIPHVTRQIYYKSKLRKNRYDYSLLTTHGLEMVDLLFTLNNSGTEHLPYADGFALAMAKIQGIALNQH